MCLTRWCRVRARRGKVASSGAAHLYDSASGPLGSALIACLNAWLCVCPSGVAILAERTIAVYADCVAVTLANNGPYSSRSCSLILSMFALRSSVCLVCQYVKR